MTGFNLRYPGVAAIPKSQSSRLDFAGAFERGRGMSEKRVNNRQGIDAAYDYMAGAPQAQQPNLSALNPNPQPQQSPGNGNNQIFSQFMGEVSQGVKNPNALAAIAATGNRESGFSEKNAFGSWSDPSESGQAGTAGGIMSWRGPRRENLKAFARQNGDNPDRPSPQTQAKFLLQEDPELIRRMETAQSPEEAQRMMNDAWRFAGYNREGGESAERIGLANNYAQQFGGQVQAPQAQQQQGGSLAQLAAGALGAQGMPMPSKEQFQALMRSEQTRPLAMAIIQARTTGNKQVAKAAFDMALQLDQRDRDIKQQGVTNRQTDARIDISRNKAANSGTSFDRFGLKVGSAPSQQMKLLISQGVDEQTAMGIASGRLKTGRNPVTGTAGMIDMADGSISPLSGQEIESPQAQAPTGQTSLYDQAGDAVGVASSVRDLSSNTLGQIPGIGDAFFSGDTVKAKSDFDLYKRDLIRSLSLNPRFPISEQKRIEDLVPTGAFVNPKTLKLALRNLDAELSRIEDETTRGVADTNRSLKARNEDAETLKGVRAARARLGIPNQAGNQALKSKYGLE